MSRASSTNRADSCHEYLSSVTKKDRNELKDTFTSELHHCLYCANYKILIKLVSLDSREENQLLNDKNM